MRGRDQYVPIIPIYRIYDILLHEFIKVIRTASLFFVLIHYKLTSFYTIPLKCEIEPIRLTFIRLSGSSNLTCR